MSAPIRDYRDLLVWQKAMDLALVCEQICETLPSSAAHLASQIRRAADSIHANIAEGNGRFSRADYLRHLSMSNGSLREVESRLHFVVRRYGESEPTKTAAELLILVRKLLSGLVRSLKRRPAPTSSPAP